MQVETGMLERNFFKHILQINSHGKLLELTKLRRISYWLLIMGFLKLLISTTCLRKHNL